MRNQLDQIFESDFLRLPRPLIRKFNLNTAVMLSEIYSEYSYWKNRNQLQTGGWFFSTVENMYYNTGLSKHQQLVACKELETYGIIKIKYRGTPRKRYFKFDTSKLPELFRDCEMKSNRSKDFDDSDTTTSDHTQHSRKWTGFSF